MKSLLVGMVWISVWAGTAAATEGVATQRFDQVLADWNKTSLDLSENDPERRAWPGVLADRAEGRVTLLAQATGLDAFSPVEFLLIGPHSGHDYEAIARSAATALHVHQALEFIGMKPGRAYHPDSLRYRAKGELVDITLAPYESGTAEQAARPAEDLLFDHRLSNAPPRLGWVFTGAGEAPGSAPRQGAYIPDTEEPGSIVSLYSETYTVLDIPEPENKSIAYGNIVPHRDHLPAEGSPWLVHFQPRRSAGDPPRVLDLNLAISPAPAHANPPLPHIRFETEHDGVKNSTTASELKKILRHHRREGRLVFLTATPSDALPLHAAREAFTTLTAWQEEGLLAIEPPESGHLFAQAFTPAPSFRDPAQRPSQPWELHLPPHPRLVRQIASAADGSLTPQAHPVENPAEAVEVVRQSDSRLIALLLFAPSNTSYRILREWSEPFLESHPIQYVFPE